ncbi:MAG: OmpA family protein [Alphaproteobacteria bacterium]|nr:OmpA family protein [Alphaproteobacteria bacterium]
MKKQMLHALMLTGTCIALTAPIAAEAGGSDSQKVVRDTGGHVVRNTFNNCVRTKWVEGRDICGAPAPVAVPRQVVQQPRTYAAAPQAPIEQSRAFLIFFDFDKAKLTKDALAIIQSASDASKSARRAIFDITGHADRSGPDAYNLKLSQRRANAVSAELQHMGVPKENIRVDFKGEREPLVPTNDGVKEPQNRRAEIQFHNE